MNSEYDWGAYPKWVKYVAVDDDMEAYGYSHKPYVNEDLRCWVISNKPTGKSISLGHIRAIYWKGSLQRRPKEKHSNKQ